MSYQTQVRGGSYGGEHVSSCTLQNNTSRAQPIPNPYCVFGCSDVSISSLARCHSLKINREDGRVQYPLSNIPSRRRCFIVLFCVQSLSTCSLICHHVRAHTHTHKYLGAYFQFLSTSHPSRVTSDPRCSIAPRHRLSPTILRCAASSPPQIFTIACLVPYTFDTRIHDFKQVPT